MKSSTRVVFGVAALAVAAAACTVGAHRHTFGLPVGKPTVASGKPTTEANITWVTTNILERSQFAHHPLDTELAGKMLDSYLDALDVSHSLFLEADLRDFSGFRAKLAQTTRASGDTSAARAIFARYLERLEQQAAFATTLLQKERFDFSGQDSYSFDREHAPRPLDLAAAQALWRQQLRAEYLQQKLSDTPLEKIADTLTRRYAEELSTMKALNNEEVLDIYLNALAHVYDPHSDYLGHEQQESLSIAMNLALFGIGAALESNDGYCEIRELVPGGPAARSGALKPGDRIVAVAQAGKPAVEIRSMPLSRTVELIRGPKGTGVTLTILPEGAPDGSVPKLVPLLRDEIKLADAEATARILDVANGKGGTLRLGVLELPSFYADMGGSGGSEHRSVTADVARLLTKLKAEKVQGLLVDLRRNGGGSLNESISLTGLFIRRGPVVQTRDPNGAVQVSADEDPAQLFDGPLVVLSSRFSASASEIFAGALQDYGRAIMVGDSSTFGKGTVQSVLPLARVMDEAGLAHSYDPGALKVTIQKFYRPSGASTQLRGVASDIVLPSTSDFSDVSESALKNPLPWDTIAPAPHEQLNWVAPYLASLREASKQRVATEKGFSYLAQDIAQLRKNLAAKSVSLNEVSRRDEMTQLKAQLAERVQESDALRANAPTAYDITLQNAQLPGLPPATKLTDRAPDTKSAAHAGRPLDSHKSDASALDDTILNETVHILADYVGLAPHAG